MKEYAKDIIIVVLTLILACISVSYFFGFLKKEKQTEKEDIFCLIPEDYTSILSVNKPEQLRHMVLEKENGNCIFRKYIPEVFIKLIMYYDFKYMLLSFHKEGVVCYIQANNGKRKEIERIISESFLPFYAPQEEKKYGIDFKYYPNEGSSFLGCYHHNGLWIASFSKKLLNDVARRQLAGYKDESANPISTSRKEFDNKATANFIVPSNEWHMKLAKGDTVIWEYPSSTINMDIFTSEGNLCSFCSFPCSVPNDSIYTSLGDSIAGKLKLYFPDIELTPQTTSDRKQIYITLCTPL